MGKEDDLDRQVKCVWIIVLFSACLGGIIHGCKSLIKHAEKANQSDCAIHYYSLPLISTTLGLGGYFLARGGFLTLGSNAGPGNPYAFSGFAFLIGMFSDQAIAKLKEIAETIFKPKTADENPPSPPPPGP